jgi:hypothetical protein
MSSSVALESTSIYFIFFRTYYLFNQFIENRQDNFCNQKGYIPNAKDDASNYERTLHFPQRGNTRQLNLYF